MQLTATRLRELLHYDPVSGAWTWRVRRGGKAVAGGPAGCINGEGYREIGVDGKLYKAHRLAVFYMTGEWPDEHVDHKNTTRSSNEWENLRPATPAQNAQNRRTHANSKTGLTGVCWHKRRGKFQAYLMAAGKRIHVGYFDSKEEAAKARDAVAALNHGAYARFTVLSR